jgi:hypothetical protein
MPDTREARRLYEELSKHSTTVGAYDFVSHEEEARFHFTDRQTEVTAACEVVEDDPDSRAQLLIRAPSVWHAVVHMRVANRGWLSGQNGLGRQMALMYRGQARASWPLTAGILRDGVDLDLERQTVYAFVDLVERFLMNQSMFDFYGMTPSLDALSGVDVEIPKVLHVATGQHYGLRTQLLDFSCDPAIAAWFACHGDTNEGEEASLFGLPTRVAEVAGGGVLLPHPYVLPLYRQRGCFVSPRSTAEDWLRGVCIEVRFPPDESFEILRGGEPVEPRAQDPWWYGLVAVARDIAEQGRTEELMGLERELAPMPFFDERIYAMSDLMDDLEPLPLFLERERRLDLMRETTDALLDMVLCLTTHLDGLEPRVSSNALRFLCRESRVPIHAMLPLVEGLVGEIPAGSAPRLAGDAALGALREKLASA